MLARKTKKDSGEFFARLFVAVTSIFTAIYAWCIINYLTAKFKRPFLSPQSESFLEQTNNQQGLGAKETIFTVLSSLLLAAISKAVL